MPLRGVVNNAAGVNVFSGPLGQKEPAYGAGERLKVLSALAPVGSPAAQNAPKRAQRAATSGKRAATAVSPTAAAPPPATAQNADTYQMSMAAFWGQVAADPEASDLVKKYAAEVV